MAHIGRRHCQDRGNRVTEPPNRDIHPETPRRSLPQRGALLVIRAYQKVLSPFFGRNCRYYPTCSHYTYEAIEIHGVIRGSWMGVKRIGRCHPFHEGGFDPVPGSTAILPDAGRGGIS